MRYRTIIGMLDAYVMVSPWRTLKVTKVSPLVRFDYMGDHSDGRRYPGGVAKTSERDKVVVELMVHF